MERNEKLSTLFFTHLYANIDTGTVNDLVLRLSEDFFLNCNVVRSKDLSYIVHSVIYQFFDYYLSYKVKIVTFDDHYELVFEDFEMLNYIDKKDYKRFMLLFYKMIVGLVNILIDDVEILDMTDDTNVMWKVAKKDAIQVN